MRYLKPKIDTGKVLEDKPTQLPPNLKFPPSGGRCVRLSSNTFPVSTFGLRHLIRNFLQACSDSKYNIKIMMMIMIMMMINSFCGMADP